MPLSFTGMTISGGMTFTNEAGAPPVTPYSIWSWGLGTLGRLGLNDTNSRSSPIQIGSGTDWTTQRNMGSGFNLAIKTDGTLWSWGSNSNGQLGQNDLVYRSSPTQVGSATNWSKATQYGGFAALFIKTDGTLWAMGDNGDGQLGLGDTAKKSSPTQVGTGTDWSQIWGGQSHVIASKTDGTLWTWGNNTYGQLGFNDIANRSSPTQIGVSNWSQIGAGQFSTSLVKTDGTLWGVGINLNGRLGTNDTISRSSPVQIGSATDWSWVSGSGVGGTNMAVKTAGTLWMWGTNTFGELGQSDTVNRSSPVQVGTNTNWSRGAPGNQTALMLTTSGQLWTWGRNSNGLLGDNSVNNSTYRSSPVQVGSSTNWASVGIISNQMVTALRS